MKPDAEIQTEFVGRLQRHRALVYKVARLFGRSPAERDDLTQEVIVNLWRAYPRYDSGLKFSTWMYRIALNVAISWRRRERTQVQHLMPAGEVNLEELPLRETAAELRGPRAALLWFRVAALLEMALGIFCVLWTGSFIGAHFGDLRMMAAAATLHLWLLGTAAVALARFLRAGAIDYSAPVIQIQRQVESLRSFTLLSLRVLFILGVPVWTIAFPVVLARSWIGLDLTAGVPGPILAAIFILGAAVSLAAIRLADFCATHFPMPPWFSRSARSLSGRELLLAQDQLAKIATFEGAD